MRLGYWSPSGSHYFFVLALAMLLFVSFLGVFSASVISAEVRFGNPYFFVQRHLVHILLACAAFYVGFRFPYRFWKQLAVPLLVVSVVLLIVVLVWGQEVSGARRWLAFPGFSFQPSELAKFSLVVFLARHLDYHQTRACTRLIGYLMPVGILALVSGLIVQEPDLGTAVLVGMVGLTLLFLAGARKRYLGVTVLLAVGAVSAAIVSSPYRWERVIGFLHYRDDPLGSGYQILQSLIALGRGGIFGKGPGAGTSKLLYLPEAHTDFVVAVLGEEYGFLGLAIVVLLFLYILSRSLQAARSAPDLFGRLLAYGFTFNLGYQALFNCGVVTACLPTKGIPFPFLSYGGSALLMGGLSCGIIFQLLAPSEEKRAGRMGTKKLKRRR